eukprot:TRINITY_DN135141_c0_g1_i1.p1 TRINITY_DN135141_c0_g1~~TRINITY_DN135141_c0_g1_i1.p1  ORF type:complete len:710 (-),score=98.05 TRINITY_DN135141_c0_g1_i1:1479-3608(-)
MVQCGLPHSILPNNKQGIATISVLLQFSWILQKRMQGLIEVVNKLQDTFAKINLPMALDLPRIAVIGAQSSGKSSVLESIVGRDFLPRGTGMVTRCPIILQLQRIKEEEDYVVFTHKEDQKFSNFEKVREEIIAETNKATECSKAVTNKPIIVKVYSKNVLNLTLVDLPGLIKVPDKDQPEDTADLIREMVLSEIKGENCVILAVSPGNFDLANSDALNLAKVVDPEGNRTLGVITKLDIMDKGTDVMDILDGRVYALKLGYVGVVCRSSLAIKQNKSLSDAAKDEKRFFQESSVYSSIKHRCGIEYLGKCLSSLLLEHVRKCIPALRTEVANALKSKRTELSTYGMEYQGNVHSTITAIISIFAEHYQATFDGMGDNNGEELNELLKGARIHHLIHTALPEELSKIKVLDELNDGLIRTTIANSRALHVCLFVPDEAFERLIKGQIKRLRDSSIKCLYMVYDELINLVKGMRIRELQGYSALKSKIEEVVCTFLNSYLKETEQCIRNVIESECTYINSEDSGIASFEDMIFDMISDELQEYMKKNLPEIEEKPVKSYVQPYDFKMIFENAISHVLGRGKKKEQTTIQKEKVVPRGLSEPLPKVMKVDFAPTKTEELKLKAMKKMLDSYFEAVKRKLTDTIPKLIITFFVDKSRTRIVSELSRALYVVNDLEALLTQDPGVAVKREACKKLITALEISEATLNQITYSN